LFSTTTPITGCLCRRDRHSSVMRHEVRFDGTNLPSGVYFYRIQAGSYTETKKVLLSRQEGGWHKTVEPG